jgi:hypothetical protein
LTKYAHEFDPEFEENKLIHTHIHKEYLIMIDELEREIFEFLLTFTDFLTFKQWMFDHRQSKISDINLCLQSINCWL